MSAPAPTPPASPGKKPVLVVSGYKKREVLFGLLLAVCVLGFLVFAVVRTGTDGSPNLLRGVVVGHYKTGEKETMLDVSRQGVRSKTEDTGFYLKVRVDPGGKVYDVMVSELHWNQHKEGARINFVRPVEEQQ